MMQTDELRSELFNLVAFLLTSARGLYDEPADYGIFRLLDASGRLLEIMERSELMDPFLAQLKGAVDAECAGEMDERRQRQALDAMVIDIAAEMQRRLSEV